MGIIALHFVQNSVYFEEKLKEEIVFTEKYT